MDPIENIYLVESKKIIKYSSDFIEQYVFDENAWGDVHALDVSDPLEILVYYQQSGQLAYLDNTLSIQKKRQLNELFVQAGVQAVCNSKTSGYWFFDLSDNTLKKVDDQSVLESSSDHALLSVEHTLTPQYLVEYQNMVALCDQHYVGLFDMKANLIEALYVDSFLFGGMDNSYLYFYTDSVIRMYALDDLSEFSDVSYPFSKVLKEGKRKIFYKNKLLFIRNDTLFRYNIGS